MQNLETGINDISLVAVKNLNDATDTANFMWGGVKGNVIIGHGKDLFICDGIDPTTGKPISQNIIDQLNNTYDFVAVHV